ncbi:hypothetical protein CDAR_560371 [Caerostris darwini]|uniref:Transmembrane protein n=1 Tax=Caerostris darwini TaxID=1538125 RepID=A0AAV4W0V6_9ARAC|nr:hypothetical protein CDAR_560111 [Caerostris darwini]GIY75673.1 hypothetical protein CDAR_560371 [Caerostris darwini]
MVSDSFVGFGHQLFNSVPFVPGYRCPPRPYGRMDSDLEPLKRSRWRPEWRGKKKKSPVNFSDPPITCCLPKRFGNGLVFSKFEIGNEVPRGIMVLMFAFRSVRFFFLFYYFRLLGRDVCWRIVLWKVPEKKKKNKKVLRLFYLGQRIMSLLFLEVSSIIIVVVINNLKF